ncbi:peptidyl-prolyl cis-trans isomerase FKBP8-like [Styela clava]
MEDITDKKPEDASITVNFENLHANMALNTSSGEEPKKFDDELGKGEDLSQKFQNSPENDAIQNVDSLKESHEDLNKYGESADEIDDTANNSDDLANKTDYSTNNGDNSANNGSEIKTAASADNEDGEAENLATMAKEIIKNAVDGAKQQVASEIENNAAQDVEKKEEWLDILGNSLLRKKILKSGEGRDSRPKREEEITVRYEAKLEDGTLVEKNDDLVFVLGMQDILDAIDISVALMERGEVAAVESDAKYAYGSEGKLPEVPPNAKLIFEIEVLKIQDGPFSSTIDLDRRIKWADAKRQAGNKLYSAKKYDEATMTYTRCTKALEKGWMCEESEAGRVRINELRIKCYNNLTASQMKQEKWQDAFKSCRAAEKLEPNNVKALFRKGKIHVMLGELDKAVDVLTKAGKLEPENKVIANEIAKHKKKLDKQKESQKKMYRRMLGTPDTSASMKPEEKTSFWSQNWGRVVGGTLAIGAVLIGVFLAQRS